MNAVRSSLPRLAALPLLLSLALGFAGCSDLRSLTDKDSIDYKSASETPRGPKLEVPPDLTQLPADNRYQVPGAASASQLPAPSSATFSSYATGQAQQPAAQPAQETTLPLRSDMHLERDGDQRRLVVVDRSPSQLYPVVREFWQDNGFLLREDDVKAGVMETDWAENRAKIPQDFLRRTIGKVFDGAWDTGERDMFRTRLERVGNNTEIYISHRGAIEELVGADKSQTRWTARPNDPGLEADMLARLMVRLGMDADRAKAQVAATEAVKAEAAKSATASATLAPQQMVTGSGSSGMLTIAEPFDRAWRRVGLAMDRGGFTVEDRNRADGIYFVRYVDVDDAAANGGSQGFFQKLFKSSSNAPESRPQYRVKLASTADSASTQVTVQDAKGAPDNSATGRRLLQVLLDQMNK